MWLRFYSFNCSQVYPVYCVCTLYTFRACACASAQICVLFVRARAECPKCMFVCFHGARLNFQIVTRHLWTRLTFPPFAVCGCIRTSLHLCFSHSGSVSAETPSSLVSYSYLVTDSCCCHDVMRPLRCPNLFEWWMIDCQWLDLTFSSSHTLTHAHTQT